MKTWSNKPAAGNAGWTSRVQIVHVWPGVPKPERWAHSRMKAEFQILKTKPKIPVVLTRDSVCAGEDGDAPHEKTVEVYSFVDPEAFARAISSGYLPSVAGVGHSWTCVLNGVRIAEVTNSGIRALVCESPFSEENRAHFVYHSSQF